MVLVVSPRSSNNNGQTIKYDSEARFGGLQLRQRSCVNTSIAYKKLKGEFMRTLVTLACTECKRRNYTTKKNKQNNPDRIEFKKYCKWCGHHTLHKETR